MYPKTPKDYFLHPRLLPVRPRAAHTGSMACPGQQFRIIRHVIPTRPPLLTCSIRILLVLRSRVSRLRQGIRLAWQMRKLVLMVVWGMVLAPHVVV